MRRSDPPVAVACAGGGQSSSNREHENNSRGGGRQGGGKVNRQRRHSNDTHNQRNQHRQQPRPKTIITPEEPASSTTSQQQQQQPPSTDETIPKLDSSDPKLAKRIHQRRRQVLFGKNTAGYEEYIKKVPRHKRRPRSLDCPMTPDHMSDIPTKRWQGLMNAWRRSLHKYDPLDLHLRQPSQDTITLAPRPCVTDADKAQEEIAQAKASGLQVAFGSMGVGKFAGLFSSNVAGEENGLPSRDGAVGVGGLGDAAMGAAGGKTEEMPFDEEAAYQQTMEGGIGDAEQPMNGGFLEESDSDSDDDVL